MAVHELNKISSDEQTASLAALVDAQQVEFMAEQMQGSGVDLEEERKKKQE
jgi:hypothetical protein